MRTLRSRQVARPRTRTDGTDAFAYWTQRPRLRRWQSKCPRRRRRGDDPRPGSDRSRVYVQAFGRRHEAIWRSLYQFRRTKRFCRHFRLDCDNLKWCLEDDRVVIEIGPRYRDPATSFSFSTTRCTSIRSKRSSKPGAPAPRCRNGAPVSVTARRCPPSSAPASATRRRRSTNRSYDAAVQAAPR